MEQTETFVLAFAALPNRPMIRFQKERRRKSFWGTYKQDARSPFFFSADCIYTTVMNAWSARKLLAGDRASSNPEQTSKGSEEGNSPDCSSSAIIDPDYDSTQRKWDRTFLFAV